VQDSDPGSELASQARAVRAYPSAGALPIRHYRHVYISPHFDDVALSAGGTLLKRSLEGEPALVVAIFTARPPGEVSHFAEYQHDRWGGAADPWAEREEEERRAMVALGADYLWLGLPDAIYRGEQYLSDDDLFGPVKPGDAPLAAHLAADALALASRVPGATFYLPLGVGGHVDHQLCFDLAEPLLSAGRAVLLYEDVPYALDPAAVERRLAEVAARAPFSVDPIVVEIESLIAAKCRAVDQYASQIPWIFRHIGPAEESLRHHAASLSRAAGHAERLWRPRGG
jgi:LmbE family N-acetylglucosaminyl deacetylase